MAARGGIYKMVFGPHRLLKASMLQDIEKGLKTEIDAINGLSVKTAGKQAFRHRSTIPSYRPSRESNRENTRRNSGICPCFN
jgi:hypothetical protein